MPKANVAELVETPEQDEFSSLALANEVLAKRKEELQDARIQLSNVRHSIQQERIQWEESRRADEAALKMQALRLEQTVAEKLGQADQLITARLEAYQQAEQERQAAVKERLIGQQERQQLGDLNRERVEVERFRLEVNRRHAETMQQWNDAQAALNTANQRDDRATKVLQEIERRTAELDTLRNTLDAREQELNLRAKHLNQVQEAIGQVIEKLPVPEVPVLAPLPAAPDVPAVQPMMTPGVQEAPPMAVIGDTLPPVPALPGLEGAVEVAPQASTGTPAADIVLPAVPGAPAIPYVHPSQRRVMDGSKPLNEQ